MKKLLITLLALMLGLSTCALVSFADEQQSTTQSTLSQSWAGCVNNFGVEETTDGLKIVYDGHYTQGLNDEYLALNVKNFKIKESVAAEGGYSQEGVMIFAFIATPNVDPTWTNDYNGVYIHVRNFGGKLYMNLLAKSESGITDLFNQTTEVNVADVTSIVLQKEMQGYSFYINGVEYANDGFAQIAHDTMCDANGKTYFAFKSYTSPDDEERGFVLASIDNEKQESTDPNPGPSEPDPVPETKYAPYFSDKNWSGPWGLFGATVNWNGLNTPYDGWYVNALTPDYIEVNYKYINFIESIPSSNGYSQESIFEFAFLNKQFTTPSWDRTSADGVYVQTRNIDGKLYVKYLYETGNGEVLLYEETIEDIAVTDAMKLIFKKSGDGFVLSINGKELAAETTASISSNVVCDANGYTFFAMQSFAVGSGSDEDKRLISLNYIANKEGQTTDPSILPPDQILTGEEDYDAPVGMGLTAKKYGSNGTVTQLENGVCIAGDSVLYTPLTTQKVAINFAVSDLTDNKVIRLSLDGQQKIYSLTDTPAAYVTIKNENGIKVSASGGDWQELTGNLENITVSFVRNKDNSINVTVNGVEIPYHFYASSMVGTHGTFLGFAMSEGVKVNVYAVKNQILNADVSVNDDWNNPFGGVQQGEETLVFAHATYKVALDNDFVKVNFKINGLIDAIQGSGYITFALLMEDDAFADPVNPSDPGLYVWMRNYGGKLQIKIAARTEYMGLIESHDWTDLDININDDISLIFLKNTQNDTYRILFNNYEIVGGKLDEILTIDASDRNGRTWFGIGCWHSNTNSDMDELLASRSIIIKSIDNVYDEEDMPESIVEIGEIEQVPEFSSSGNETSGSSSNNGNTGNSEDAGCVSYIYANVFGIIILFAGVAMIKRKLFENR